MLLPKIDVTDVLIDMDDTISYAKPGKGGCGAPQFLLELTKLVAKQAGISEKDALSRIHEAGDPETSCIFSFLPALGVSAETYWKRTQEWLPESIGVYEDAFLLIRSLHEMGIRLYSASTNSKMVVLSKLATAGLATMEGSPYFTNFFGGNVSGDPLGKFSPAYFPTILKKARLNPEKTLMVGDDPRYDLAPALAAGIRQVVIVRRIQKEPFTKGTDGGLYVNSLEVVVKMIRG